VVVGSEQKHQSIFAFSPSALNHKLGNFSKKIFKKTLKLSFNL